MRLTIGKKLGLGFGIVIVLMIVMATVAYVKVRKMSNTVTDVVDEAFPTKTTCERLRNGVTQQIASLRGYLILGADPVKAKNLKEARATGVTEIGTELKKLSAYSRQWQDAQLRNDAEEIRQVIQEFLEVEQRIEDIAYTPENIPAYDLLRTKGEPLSKEMLGALSVMIDEEATIAPTVERRMLLKILADSRASIAGCMDNVRACMLSGDAEFRRDFEGSWADNQRAYDAAEAGAQQFTPTQRVQWEQYKRRRAELLVLSQKLFAVREGADWNKAQFIVAEEAIPRIAKIDALLRSITAGAEQRMDEKRGELDAASRALVLTLLLATVFAVSIASLVAVLLSRQIISTSRRLADRVQQISCGDLTGEALVIKSADELGQLANGFDTMLTNLRDLTGQILSVTENVNSATTQISASTQQQAASTKEQAAAVQEITSTMQELSQSGGQIVEKAKEVAAAAEATASNSKAGIEAVKKTSNSMQAIREQVEEVAENIVALSEKTQAVGEIIATVTDVAEQSNLLALNATIEAAEAGDEGNRFSVVASEMKNLADQAKQCTVQVRTILSEIQKGINTAVMLTEEAVKRVETGKQQADLSEQSIRQMSETTEQSVQAFQQIIASTNQQQVGFEQVSRGMKDIDQATQQTASGTSQLEQAVVSLSSLSQQLKTAVSGYRV